MCNILHGFRAKRLFCSVVGNIGEQKKKKICGKSNNCCGLFRNKLILLCIFFGITTLYQYVTQWHNICKRPGKYLSLEGLQCAYSCYFSCQSCFFLFRPWASPRNRASPRAG